MIAEHKQHHYLQSSGFRNDLLIGMADGILLPFALAAVLSFIVDSSGVLLLVCGLESVVLAFLFAVAAYQSVANQAEEYPREGSQKKKGFVPHLQLIQILRHLDLEADILEKATLDGADYKNRWGDLLSSYGLGTPQPDYARARKNGFFVGLAFLMGAIPPLVPYIFIPNPLSALKYAAIVTFLSLLVFGYFKSSYMGQNPWKGALRFIVTGIIIAGAACLAAYFFNVY